MVDAGDASMRQLRYYENGCAECLSSKSTLSGGDREGGGESGTGAE